MRDNREVENKQGTVGALEKAQLWSLRVLKVPALGVAAFGLPGIAVSFIAHAMSGNGFSQTMRWGQLKTNPGMLPVYLLGVVGNVMMAPLLPYVLIRGTIQGLEERAVAGDASIGSSPKRKQNFR